MDETISLRVNLSGETLEQFLRIKEQNQFQRNTEVIRYCIQEAVKEGQLNIDEQLAKHIETLINSKYIQQKFLIFNIKDFMRKAVENYLQEIERSIESIASFDVRQQLTEFENKIALAILEIQENSPHGMASESAILNHLGLQGRKKVRKTLEHLYEQKLIDRQVIGDTIYYHAKY